MTIDGETLTTTKEHPFYTLESGWQEVDDLSVGEHIRKADGTYGTVTKIEVNQLPQWMYNLTVDQAHTFYVGNQEWLVHNASCPILNNKKVPYPDVTVQDYGKVPFPNNPQYTRPELRVPRSATYRSDYIDAWIKSGKPEPFGGWSKYKIHHIRPLEYGGNNSISNLVHLTEKQHSLFTKWWAGGYGSK